MNEAPGVSGGSVATERVKRERFLPFAFVNGGLELTVGEVRVDEHRYPAPDGPTLHIEEPHWEMVRLTGRVAVSKEALVALPEDERSEPAKVSRVLLVVRCDRTMWRSGQAVPWSGGEPDAGFELRIPRAEVEGAVHVAPWLVRTAQRTVSPGFAGFEGARLARGAGLTLYPHAPTLRAGKFLEVVYTKFSEDASLRTQPHRLYHLEAHGPTPVLRINADHEAIARVLDARGQTGLDARMREVLYDQISRGVWAMLFMSAVEAMDEDGDTPEPWQQGVLDEMLPHVFPAAAARDRMTELLALRDDRSSLSLLAERCDDALQRRLELVKHMNRLVEETGAAGLDSDPGRGDGGRSGSRRP